MAKGLIVVGRFGAEIGPQTYEHFWVSYYVTAKHIVRILLGADSKETAVMVSQKIFPDNDVVTKVVTVPWKEGKPVATIQQLVKRPDAKVLSMEEFRKVKEKAA